MSDTMIPVNYENWGKLLKTWSTGRNYLEDGNDYQVPTTLAELKAQLELAQTGLELPARITALQVVVAPSDTLVLRVPPADALLAAEAILATEDYALPPFYSDHFAGLAPTPLPDAAARLRFQAQRIGDYSIANCQ